MKTAKLLLLLMLGAVPCAAQEYATREVHLREANSLNVGAPVDVTAASSETTLRYEQVPSPLFQGDYLSGLEFRGYNPGLELTRHVSIRVSTDLLGKEFATAFEGDCTIPAGGTKEASISLLKVEFPEPIKVVQPGRVVIKVASTGEPAAEAVFFEQYKSEAGELPAVTVGVQSEVAYYDGTVTNQDGKAVSDAQVTVFNDFLDYRGTATDGKCRVRVEEGNAPYALKVTATGYPEYVSGQFYLKDMPGYHPQTGSVPADVVLFDRLDFTANQQATIILPEAPDPAWGRFYRLDRHEGGDIIFEREQAPKANVPYVIFPDREFSIRMADYDLSKLPEPSDVPFIGEEDTHAGFFGSYKSQPTRTDLYDGEAAYLLDATPDCNKGSDGKHRVGAFRAYLVLGTYSPEMRYNGPRLVFVGEKAGIGGIAAKQGDAAPARYDLQGRRLSGVPERGVYIENGRKRVVR